MTARIALPIYRSKCIGLTAIALLWLISQGGMASAADRLTVHEWGTFTALQDEQGRALGGINVDDEQLPAFVHDINPRLLSRPYSLGAIDMLSKGIPPMHPDVAMRLETPVIYFHLPPGAAPMKLDVDVALRGGWLTQYYPNADADAPGLKPAAPNAAIGRITPHTIGRLAWHGLTVGTSTTGPKTDAHVWSAPRNVNASNVTTGGDKPESEKYLFYRGVGNLSAPLEVATDAAKDQIELRGRFEEVLGPSEHLSVGPLWLVQIQSDGQVAYRTISPLSVSGDRSTIIGQAPGSFAANDFATGNLDRLRYALRQALVRDGLFSDEATALIETWNQAYFRSPGLRLFFLVPRRWTDHYLPLSFSVPTDLDRVMVGRIELISAQQRTALKKLAETTGSNPNWIWQVSKVKNPDNFFAGRSDFEPAGVAVPPEYQAYLDLGRFRNALILDAERRHPTPTLTKFIANYELQSFSVPGDAAAKH